MRDIIEANLPDQEIHLRKQSSDGLVYPKFVGFVLNEFDTTRNKTGKLRERVFIIEFDAIKQPGHDCKRSGSLLLQVNRQLLPKHDMKCLVDNPELFDGIKVKRDLRNSRRTSIRFEEVERRCLPVAQEAFNPNYGICQPQGGNRNPGRNQRHVFSQP